jgi:hypothetical protein
LSSIFLSLPSDPEFEAGKSFQGIDAEEMTGKSMTGRFPVLCSRRHVPAIAFAGPRSILCIGG